MAAKNTEVSQMNAQTAAILSNPTQPVIVDNRGPVVYDLSQKWSDNGVDPTYMKKEGV